ncbi:MAG: DUF2510 domain-containing protein [Solirubrobacteraceae bacterium]|nr:DUF2510 domain-containing protein [Solirubrobacteraceae bacterium]
MTATAVPADPDAAGKLVFVGRAAAVPAGLLGFLAVVVREGWGYGTVSRIVGLVLAVALLALGVASLLKADRRLDLAIVAIGAALWGGLGMQSTYGTSMTLFAIAAWLVTLGAWTLTASQFVLAGGDTIANAISVADVARATAAPASGTSFADRAVHQPPAPAYVGRADGWYADESDPSLVRYFVNGAWTDHTQANPNAVAADALPDSTRVKIAFDDDPA